MTIVADTMRGTMFFDTEAKLRDSLRRQFGAGCFRLTKGGHIDVYAVMPNTNVTRWWRFGDWLVVAEHILNEDRYENQNPRPDRSPA